MKAGIYDLPEEKYFAVDAISNSALRHFRRSPAHYQYAKANPKDPTPQMIDGVSFHKIILEPDKFWETHILQPADAPNRPQERHRHAKKPSKATLDAFLFWDQYNELAGDKRIITQEQADMFLEVSANIRNHPEIKPFLQRGRAEASLIGQDPETKLWCKCRPDFMTCVGGYDVMLELKSTDDARPDKFQRTAYNFEYFKAGAFYTDVAEWSGVGRPDVYLIVAFERDPPHGIKLYEVPESEMERGRNQYRVALDQLAYCKETGKWPGYSTDIEPLEFPAWAKD